VPALFKSHDKDNVSSAMMVRQWLYFYEAGKTQNPPLAVATTASLAYLAWTFREEALRNRRVPASPVARLYGTAAVLTLAIIPFTLILMAGTNRSLIGLATKVEAAKGVAALDDKEVVQLLTRWNTYNLVRSSLPLLSALAACAAVLA